MKKTVLISLLLIVIGLPPAIAQNTGDTTVVQTLEFSDITKRRGWYVFPSETNTYSKILMYYTLKCDAATTQDGYACGEWDYTTYTNLYQHENIGSSYYYLGSNNPDTIFYVSNPIYDYNQSYQYFPVYDATTSETSGTVGVGATPLTEVFNTSNRTGKTQYIFTASELTTAGIIAGPIDKLALEVSAVGPDINNLRISIKHTALNELTPASYETGLQEVYSINTSIVSVGTANFNFHTPFTWDGTSNVVVELCFDNTSTGADFSVSGDAAGFNSGITGSDNGYLDFGSGDYVEVPSAAFSNISDEITVSFWCYGDPDVMPMNSYIFEGRDANGYRVVNSHLPWSNSRVYWDAGNSGTNSYDRVDEAANSSDFSGQWNHWAFTKNALTGDMAVYLNGNVFTSGAGLTRTMAGIETFKIGGPGQNDYSGRYDGLIDEFRVWNAALDQTAIQDWMNKTVDATHPNIANLQAAYNFNDLTGTVAVDYSANGHDAQLMGLPSWNMESACDVNSNTLQSTNRPNMTFIQGVYTSHLDSVLVIDSAEHHQVSIIETTTSVDMNVAGIASSPVDTTYGWLPGYSYTFDTNGIVIDSTYIVPDGFFVNTYNQTTHQIQNYVTPYGIGLNLGVNGFRWVYDVTDYKPLFHDTVEFSAGNQQELIDVKFIMIHGTPPRDVVDFETIWLGDYQHSNIANDISMPAVDVDLNSSATQYTVKTRTTGHWFGGFENCAEFCPKLHDLSINGTQQFQWLNWKTCADNPVISQGGTWIYDRAGWCPGTFGDTYDHDITPYVTPGGTASIDYGMEYDATGMEGNYRTTVQLVSYGEINFTNNATVDDIISPNIWEYHNRVNPICDNPKIVIKNNGSANLTSATIEFWVCNGGHESFNWTGNLAFGEAEEVELPISGQGFWFEAQDCKWFNVDIVTSNGASDDYDYDNTYSAEFEAPKTYPSDFYIWTITNNAASENELYVYDENGNVIFSRTNFANSTTYKDTLNLSPGCYKMEFLDSDGDGLGFFANSDGNGSIKTKMIGGPQLDQFDSDFGAHITHYFTVGYTLSEEEIESYTSVEIFPNPSDNIFNIEVEGFGKRVNVVVLDATGRQISNESITSNDYLIKTQINLEGMESGIYFVKIGNGEKQQIKKLIKK
jgi:hypothetical protein